MPRRASLSKPFSPAFDVEEGGETRRRLPVSQSVSQSVLIRGPHNLRRSKDPSPATGEGALEGEWSLSPTIIDNKRRTRRRKKTLTFRPLAPALELKPLLSPSRVTNAVQQTLLPTRTTLSGLYPVFLEDQREGHNCIYNRKS